MEMGRGMRGADLLYERSMDAFESAGDQVL
jgi:hypothetical protein